jgi:hypothetical protein
MHEMLQVAEEELEREHVRVVEVEVFVFLFYFISLFLNDTSIFSLISNILLFHVKYFTVLGPAERDTSHLSVPYVFLMCSSCVP